MGKRQGMMSRTVRRLDSWPAITASIQMQWAGDLYRAVHHIENCTTACRFSGALACKNLSFLKPCIEGMGAHLLINHFIVDTIWK